MSIDNETMVDIDVEWLVKNNMALLELLDAYRATKGEQDEIIHDLEEDMDGLRTKVDIYAQKLKVATEQVEAYRRAMHTILAEHPHLQKKILPPGVNIEDVEATSPINE